MKKRFLFFILLCSFTANELRAQIDAGDSLALVDLYNSTGGYQWADRTNWLTKKPVSTWHGITVANQRVIKILLYSNLLKGSLPSSIGNLDSLNNLFLGQNELSDTIPASIGNLHSIIQIDLQRNLLTGTIPASMGNLSTLVYLEIDFNLLTGVIPESLSHCSHLASILLGNNQLTGNIPAFIRNLPDIITVDLNHNRLSGKLPDIFPPGSQLFYFDIGHNRISGSIPPSIGNLKVLSTLNLYENKLTGTIPNSIGQMSSLAYTNMGANKLSGSLPPSVKNLRNLEEFAVYNNELTDGNNLLDAGEQDPGTIIYVEKNRLTFNSLEQLAKRYKKIVYAPQAAINVHNHSTFLAVSAGGTLANNTYRWYTAGTTGVTAVITGDSTFRPVKSGQYYVQVRNSVATDLVLKTDTVSFSTGKDNLNLSVLPNPVTDILLIQGLNDSVDEIITIADMSGYVWTRTVVRQQSAMKMDVSRLRAGNYVVSVSDGKEVKTIQFVKE